MSLLGGMRIHIIYIYTYYICVRIVQNSLKYSLKRDGEENKLVCPANVAILKNES